ncbi:MAG: 30S ribosomal protein S12 methylthiotransferase RimO [Terriglobales bacterium]
MASTPPPTKVGFISLGCPKNLVDSEVMMGQLARHGFEITPQAEDADVLVVNTCSFIEPARQESVDTILEMAAHKKTGKARRLVVAGCLVERYREQIRAEIPEVDAVIGTNEIEQIVAAVAPAAAPAATANPAAALLPVLPADFFDPRPSAPYLYDDLTPRLLATPRHTAYIKIAEGCDHPCSFCVIPQFRGRFRSRRFESVVAEARRLATAGTREIVLIGQDTTCYGEDLGLRHGLAQLLASLAEIDELAWIRALYFYPNKVTPQLLEAIAAHPRLCKYVDMPLQHASPAVLKRMKRGGGAEIFLRLIERIRRTIPGVSLRTSMIVGFPGETEADFDLLCDFVREAQFDWLGVFAYSDEETGAAYHLDGKVPGRVIAARRRRLLALQRQISRRRRRAQVGQRLPALLEGPADESDLLWQGRLESQAPEIDGKILINEFAADAAPPAGSIGTVEITAAHDYDLVATWLAE